MTDFFSVEHLDAERLLETWRWLYAAPLALIARNVFGDLFLVDVEGKILWLEVGAGKVTKVAESEAAFRELLNNSEARNVWMTEAEELEAERRGLVPNDSQCIGFKIPIVFAESATAPENAYVADLYEQVAFLGDLHRQVDELPAGSKVRLQLDSEG